MRNCYTEKCFWILMCFWIQVTQQYDDNNQTFCYNDINTSYCVLCGCYQSEETQHSLSCGENEVIRMEAERNPMKVTKRWYPSCGQNKDMLCKTGFNDTDVVTTYTDRIAAYKLCTLQNTCTFTVKPVANGIKVVRYPHVCEKNIINMSNPISLQVILDPVLHFTGKDHVGENINCGCTVTPSGQQTMELEIFYINGDNICNSVTFNSFHIFQCTNNTQLYTNKTHYNINVLNITIKDITASGDDVLYFKVHGEIVRVTCSGCLQNTVSSTTTSNTVMSENTDQDRSSITTTSMSSNEDQSTTQSNQQNDMTGLGFISRAEHDEKLKAIFSGFIAAILIAILLGIGIYCFIRKRKSTDKLSHAPNQPVSTIAEHDNVESSHYEELNVYLSVTG